MNKLLTLLVVAMLSLCLGLSAQLEVNDLKELISKEMANSKTPGLAYAAIKDTKITSIGAEGVLEKGQSSKVNEDSLFILGSVSKSFTALAIMQLVEDGRFELDVPFSKVLINFSDSPLSEVTIRQLLNHTSGLSTLQGNQSQTDYTTDSTALTRRVDSLIKLKPKTEPGTQWSYSNANYQILGRVIEVISGESYESYIEENILKPLGMKNSFIFKGVNQKNMAVGHRPWFGSKRALTANKTGLGSAPQGGVVSSANDMALYMAMMINEQDDIISAKGKQLMMTAANDVSPNYGFGWFVNTKMGLVFHTGSNPGYESLLTMRPSSKEAAAVLVNAGSGYGFGITRPLRFGVSSALLGLPYAGEKTVVQMATFISMLILPFLLLFGIFRSWQKRKNIKQRYSVKAKLGLYFPLVLAGLIAWALFVYVPGMFGVPYSAAAVFQPDMGFLLAIVSVLTIFWAGIRIILYALSPRV